MGIRTLNVLSIDFDFFQIVDTKTIYECYPDGLDLPTNLTEITWAGHYQHPVGREKLLKVRINEKLLDDVKELVLCNAKDSNIPFMVANSHRHIYKFIKEQLSSGKYDSVHIYNLDMHHDYKNRNNEVDCGNWLGMAVKHFPNCQATWVMNPISMDLIDENEVRTLHKVKTLRNLKDVTFDTVYLCRSDSWTPPHLDEYFNELLCELSPELTNAIGEKTVCIQENRVYTCKGG